MTAVWVQISTVQVKQSHGTEAGPAGAYELEVKFGGPTSVEMVMKKNGKNWKKAAFKAADVKGLLPSMDTQLGTWVTAIGPQKPEPGQIAAASPVSAAMVSPKTGVTYGDLVMAMDVLRRHQIVNLGIVPVGEGK